MLYTAFSRGFIASAFSATLALSACQNDKVAPYQQLTPEERAWAAPYQADTEWRFRGSRGTERIYRMQSFSDEKQALLDRDGKAEAYVDVLQASFYRADTVASPRAALLLTGRAATSTVSPARFSFENCFVDLPVDELAKQRPLPTGFTLLPQFTTSTRTYQNVLHYHQTQYFTADLYYSKELGVVRYVEKGITWDRL